MSVSVVPVLEELNSNLSKNEPFDDYGGMVYFIETDREGKERVCRTEEWRLRKDSSDPDVAAEFTKQRKHQEGKPQFLALIAKGYLAENATNFHYDDKSQLIQATSFDVRNPFPYYTTACYRYDDLGRVVLHTSVEGLRNCDEADKLSPQNIRKVIDRYAYVSRQQPWLARRERFYLKDDGTSAGQIEGYSHPGTFFFRADVDGPRGLAKLSGAPNSRPGDNSPEWDLADRNSVNVHTTRFDYYFPRLGPVRLLDDLTKISQYDRVRVSYVSTTGPDQINEVITAKGELLARYFADNNTFRQDIFKNGRLVRVLISRGQEHIGNRESRLYYEDPAPLQAFAAKKKTPVTMLTSRVYDVTPEGKWVLVAAGWFRDPPPKKGLSKLFSKRQTVVLGTGGVETVDGKKTWDDDRPMLLEYGFDRAMKAAHKFGMPDPTY